MDNTNYEQAALFEHRFWLQVLGDHARFLLQSLAPTEVEEIQAAHHFIHIFDLLLERSRLPLSSADIATLNQQAFCSATDLRSFKLSTLRRLLEGEITIHLGPTFLNHMVNEVDEYLRILQFLLAGERPPACHPLHHHLVWLPDAAGHAGAIASSLDMTEKQMIARSEEYQTRFEQFFIKAYELAGYLRTNLEQFPALARFNQEVELEIQLFSNFLEQIEQLEMDHRLLGILSPLFPDHMMREECYYLMKLAEVTEIAPLDCDQTRPRNE